MPYIRVGDGDDRGRDGDVDVTPVLAVDLMHHLLDRVVKNVHSAGSQYRTTADVLRLEHLARFFHRRRETLACMVQAFQSIN